MTSPYGTGTVTPFTLSGNINIDALANIGIKWGSGGQGVDAVVTYSFPQTGAAWISDYYDGEPFDGFQGFNAAQQNAARQALALWSDVANITFQEVPDTANDVGDIRFGFSRVVTNSPSAAWAYSPYADPNYEFPEAGDVWLDGKYAPNLQMAPGKFGFSTLLHEIGHAIGLDHPFDDGYGEPTIPGSMNTNQYTLMAYGQHLTASVEAMTPMLLDILAIQYIYGANMTTRTGDDVYKFSTSEQLRAIWDAGGIDTLDASNQALAATIDLEEGAFSSIGRRNAGGAAQNNIAIAYGAVIENATGGSGGDKIFGNEIANVLAGNAGNDILDGRAGADTMRGGRGNDVYVFDDVGDVLDEQGSKDLGDEIRIAASVNLVSFAGGVIERATALGNAAVDLTGNKAVNILTGNSAINVLDGAAGADTLKGGAGNDIYYIDTVSDRIDEGANKDGADEVRSTVTVNLTTLGKGQIEIATLLGAAAANVTGNGFNNFITGNDAANNVSGGDGNDTLIGMNGKDTLTGGNGSDTLDGGIGNDVLNGGLGNDTYVIDSVGDKIIDSGSKDLDDLVISSISVDLGILGAGLLEHATLAGADPLAAIGNGRNNILAGNAGANLLFGDLGDDKLDGGLGGDTLRGGKGNDTYSIDADDIVDEQGNVDTGDQVLTALSIDLAIFAAGAIEHVVFSSADTINAFGNGASNSLTGNDNANTLDGRDGNDTLIGNGGDDILIGGAGDDVMNGGAGTNILKGGAGNDVYYRSTFGEVYTIDEEANLDTGDEIRVIGSVDLSVFANGAIEHATLLEHLFTTASSLVGNAGFNILTGSSYFNYLDGAGGDDLLIGGGGGDIYTVDSDGDVIQETGDDVDEVRSSVISLDLTKIGNGAVENARLEGSLNLNIVGIAGYGMLVGNSGDNKIDGSSGGGSLNGGGGNDYLITGQGRNYIHGGDGDDILQIANPLKAELISGGAGSDTLFLSSGGLKIDFRYDLGGLSEIEAIDVRNGDRDDLQFDEGAVLEMSFTTDQLKIRGDAGDYVRLSAEFVDQGDTVVDGVTYSVLASKNATVLVESGIELRNEAIGKVSLADLPSEGITLIDSGNQHAGSAGDFNNDGIDDLVFGATASGGAWIASGSTSGFPTSISTNPLSVPGVTIAGDDSSDGYDVAGDADFNGDGVADVLLRNPFELVNGHIQGGAFAIFGSTSLTSLNLNALQGSQGFKITTTPALGKSLDSIATVSDFNGDGYDDFLIGAPTYGSSGQAFLVLGRASTPSGSIALAPGSGVFAITGKSIPSFGQDVADAGDLNGDGYNDIIISGSGKAEIVYGRKGASMPSLLNGANAVAISGPLATSQSVGDLNGDGYDDLVLQYNGYSQVFFGTAAKFTSTAFEVVNGTNGFMITDKASFAGDINADGYDDLIVTSYDPSAGYAAAVVYGHAGVSHWVVQTTQLNSNQALLLERGDPNAITSLIDAAGDTNGDGFDDILVGAFIPGMSEQLFHIQGADFRDEVDFLGTSGADKLVGSTSADRIVAAQGNDTVLGGGGADVINAGQGNDELHVGDNKFFRIDGGGDIDTLHFDYVGAIDLANLDGNKATSDRGRISNIEILDVANGFANSLTLRLADVLDLDVTIANVGGKAVLDNVLRIDGEIGDTLHMFKADGWGVANFSSLPGYAVYSYQAVKVAVDTDIAISLT